MGEQIGNPEDGEEEEERGVFSLPSPHASRSLQLSINASSSLHGFARCGRRVSAERRRQKPNEERRLARTALCTG
ncbi:unnamed protein product [Bursaphelenchus xylophilus]|uniref:(pine wood nematode) hypothetical protein n=1 Tax=Bursaphelenchus xylophilus TaxID=6326 RepID=A0A1I7SX77_BURXY|nr:unnamed protein product [Bursaphelenchus xylophilus]CAG9100236.1 unnamed protein product [Bursaphelenchus xylophilus]